MLLASNREFQWKQSMVLWIVFCGMAYESIVSIQAEPHCSSTFQVWQPGQDAQRMIRELYMKMDNVTSFTKYQVAEIRAYLANEVNRISNWTFAVDKRVFEMQISRMDEELLQMKYATGSSKIQSEVQHTSRRVDDLEKSVYSIRSKLRNLGGTSVNARPPNLQDSLQSQQGISEELGQTLQNRIGDLTAEWVLLKRDVVGLEKEDKRHRRQIQTWMNQTAGLKASVEYVSSVNKDLQGKNLELTIKQSDIKQQMNEIVSSARHMQTALDQFKSQNKINFQEELHKLQDDLVALTSRLDKMAASTSGNSVHGSDIEIGPGETLIDPHVETIHLSGQQEKNEIDSIQQKSDQPLDLFKDCHDAYRAGFHSNGVYDISPDGSKHKVSVYCHMINGTGYTVIQRRIDGTINFNRRWMEYQQGFGNPYGEVWMGNELIHRLTKQKRCALRLDLWDWEGGQFYAEYTKFRVEGEDENYRIHVGGYTGDAGDSFSYHDKMSFSTEDMDNDMHSRNCAAENKGGWWYNSCFYSQLNGLYHTGWYSGTQSKYADGVVWFTLKDNEFYSVKKVEMAIKPLEI